MSESQPQPHNLALELDRLCQQVMAHLKPFQQATVERIDTLFRTTAQRRILVADEVGLGKTLIAKGVIAKLAKLRMEEHDNLFKVVYVCSNQAIAKQNISKLQISPKNNIDNSVSECRLSMQHLRILEQEIACKKSNTFIQLTPLTPGTSFQIGNGQGCAPERALMCLILENLFPQDREALSDLFRCHIAKKHWDYHLSHWRKRIQRIQDVEPQYLQNVLKSFPTQLSQKIQEQIRQPNTEQTRGIIRETRRKFAEISAASLHPDLIIMDEFQRFSSLLNDTDDDMKIITEKFLGKDETQDSNLPRILLLSATPYKLYSTLDEIDENNCDQHYQDFMEVMKFLHGKKREQFHQFQNVWRTYSACLGKFDLEHLTILKCQAEKALYDVGMCRTERLSFIRQGDFLQQNQEDALTVEPDDVKAYLQLTALCQRLQLNARIPFDYVKSCPFLLSFMDRKNYKLKERILKHVESGRNASAIRYGKANALWLKQDDINRFRELKIRHAKFTCLRQFAFENQAQRLLWIPPAMTYYAPRGAFLEAQDFTKCLIFSAWEMVPKMIATLLSYECERLTNGRLARKYTRKHQRNYTYFSKIRFPQNHLFNNTAERGKKNPQADGRRLPNPRLAEDACILWKRSPWLESMAWPKASQQTAQDLLEKVKENLRRKLEGIPLGTPQGNPYAYVLDQLDGPQAQENAQAQQLTDDCLEVLAKMAVASPGICLARALRKAFNTTGNELDEHVERLTMAFLRMFDSAEGAGAIAQNDKDLEHYPMTVLNYCLEGNFQAMVDEYLFVLKNNTNGIQEAVDCFATSLELKTSTYSVDYCDNQKDTAPALRTHYAVCFNKATLVSKQKQTESPENNTAQESLRADSLRTAFNSPFRPFILASTSVGQEGLDFHHYCHRIMHWNLPHNPIDLEQREGRINRYMCHAVRKSLVRSHPHLTSWEDLCEEARPAPGLSGLTPLWCFSQDQPVKIQRIVPLYPFSRETASYLRLKKLLSLYRLTMGQQRQEELLDAIFTSHQKDLDLLQKCQKLFINLCPFLKSRPPEENH